MEAIYVIKEVPGTALAKGIFCIFDKRLRDEFTLNNLSQRGAEKAK